MSPSVVLVDQHQALREGLALLLESRGWTVSGASGSWRAGLDLIGRHAPDVALVGIRLADGDGITLTRQALRVEPGRRVLLYTDPSDEDEVRAGLESGARGYVLRAGSTEELVRALGAVA